MIMLQRMFLANLLICDNVLDSFLHSWLIRWSGGLFCTRTIGRIGQMHQGDLKKRLNSPYSSNCPIGQNSKRSKEYSSDDLCIFFCIYPSSWFQGVKGNLMGCDVILDYRAKSTTVVQEPLIQGAGCGVQQRLMPPITTLCSGIYNIFKKISNH